MQKNPWWWVKLAKPMKISKVTLYNRMDCCSGRLSKALVYIQQAGKDSKKEICGRLPDMKNKGEYTVDCKGKLGQYVVVMLVGSKRILSLAEVEVEGHIEVEGGACRDDKKSCSSWSKKGYCRDNSKYKPYMSKYCRKSCCFCTLPGVKCQVPRAPVRKLTKAPVKKQRKNPMGWGCSINTDTSSNCMDTILCDPDNVPGKWGSWEDYPTDGPLRRRHNKKKSDLCYYPVVDAMHTNAARGKDHCRGEKMTVKFGEKNVKTYSLKKVCAFSCHACENAGKGWSAS